MQTPEDPQFNSGWRDFISLKVGINLYIIDFCDIMEFNIIIEKGEDGYLISEVIELPGCHTQGKTMDELIKNTKEAISLYLKATNEDISDKFIGIQRIEV